MSAAFDDDALARIQIVYDNVVLGLFGGSAPDQRTKERIAAAILYMGAAPRVDWIHMAPHLGARIAVLLTGGEILLSPAGDLPSAAD